MKYIYKIENIVNGKVYIGQTVDFEKRFIFHKNALKHKYQNEIKKYDEMRIDGIENLRYSVIEEVEDSVADEIEKYYIGKYNTIENGYNTANGGIGNCGKPTEETLLKRSIALKGLKKPKSFSEKMSLVHKGKTLDEKSKEKISNSLKQYYKENSVSDETRNKLSIKSIGRKQTEKSKKIISEKVSKEVCQYDIGGNFIKSYKNARIASNETNTNFSNISSCCNGKRNKAGGYMWKFRGVVEL